MDHTVFRLQSTPHLT